MTRFKSRIKTPTRRLVATGIFDSAEGAINYKIFRDKRITGTFNFSWKHGRGLVLTVPWNTKLSEAKQSIHNNQKWIVSCMKKQNRIAERPDLPQLKHEGYLLYRGKPYQITLSEPDAPARAIEIKNDSIVLPRKLVTSSDIEIILIKWMKKQAHLFFPEVIAHISDTLNIPVQKISIRDQRTRWASWSTAGRSISINWRLVMAPPDVFNYVVIHELLHSIHPNHSKDFWLLVEKHCKHWRSSRQWLGKNTDLMIVFR
jgi:predicted metal-dependent hydrolase